MRGRTFLLLLGLLFDFDVLDGRTSCSDLSSEIPVVAVGFGSLIDFVALRAFVIAIDP